jgi:hypothetical protein
MKPRKDIEFVFLLARLVQSFQNAKTKFMLKLIQIKYHWIYLMIKKKTQFLE